jgi:predicted DsbA family dithiol-disulfide isomerase
MTAENRELPADFRVVVFADFVCPYSFLAVDQIDRLARAYNVKPLWRPHWLHPDTPREGTQRESNADTAARDERRHAWFKEMAPEQYQRMRFPEKRHYSFLAFEALEFARDQGLDFPYKTAVYELMWAEGRDIGEIETLTDAAARVGMDAAAMKLALEEHLYAEQAFNAVNQAREIGIMNTPTIFLGKTRINGWTYDEVIEQVMEKQGVRPLEALAS